MKHVALFLLVFLAVTSQASAGTLAQFRAPFGTIDVELYDQDKPVTVQNFVRYVESGAYTNMFLHRCLPGFVVQGGGFSTSDPLDTNILTSVHSVSSLGAITNEFNVGPRLSNVYGTIAMAKAGGDPNSASSQWFFNLGNNSANLDNQNGGFTVFGRLIGGTNVLNLFNAVSKGNGIVDLQKFYGTNQSTEPFTDLPVHYFGQVPPHYNDLVYVDVSLLSVQVRLTGAGREISWTSVSNKLNTVEFTTNFPPVWQSLTATNGTGESFKFVDSDVAAPLQFYRVRVDY